MGMIMINCNDDDYVDDLGDDHDDDSVSCGSFHRLGAS